MTKVFIVFIGQQPGKFETYVCVVDHPCAVDTTDNQFCFVWSEEDSTFVPWVRTGRAFGWPDLRKNNLAMDGWNRRLQGNLACSDSSHRQ